MENRPEVDVAVMSLLSCSTVGVTSACKNWKSVKTGEIAVAVARHCRVGVSRPLYAHLSLFRFAVHL